jgi:hypothetical protein
MLWECSECGARIERPRAPALCGDCGTAGVHFLAAGVDDASGTDPEADSPRAAWLRAGFSQPRLPLVGST